MPLARRGHAFIGGVSGEERGTLCLVTRQQPDIVCEGVGGLVVDAAVELHQQHCLLGGKEHACSACVAGIDSGYLYI